jgi:iron complex outermembrane recepter protein
MDRTPGCIHRASTALLVAAAFWCCAANADILVHFDLPAQSLATSLKAIGTATNTDVGFSASQVAGRMAPSLRADLTVDGALMRVLAGTGLRPQYLDDHTIVIAAAASSKPKSADIKLLPVKAFTPAEAGDQIVTPQTRPVADSTDNSSPTNVPKRDLDEIVVTGTHIHGADPLSPVIRLTHDQIVEQGYSRLDELMDQLPQNFSGGGTSQRSNPIPGGGGGDGGNNYAFASGVNLRGLGANATLVLLNGQRLPATAYGTSVDISRIPLSVIDRVEILTDGASATYGADAVAGVVNIITRTDFDGLETGARMDSAASGKTPNDGADVLGGYNWNGGKMLLGIDYEKDNPLYARNRSFAASSLPGDSMLLPRTETSSIYASVRQDLSAALALSIDALASRRTFFAAYNPSGFANKNFGGGDQIDLDAHLNYAFTENWTSAISLSIGNESDQNNQVYNNTASNTNIKYRTESAEAQIDGKLFALPAGPVQTAFGASIRAEYFDDFRGAIDSVASKRKVGSAYGEILVPVVASDAEIMLVKDLRLSVSGRFDHYDDFGGSANPKIGIQWTPIGDVVLSGTYGTSFRAPALSQLDPNALQIGYVYDFPDPSQSGGTRRSLFLDNTANPALKPERSRSINFSVRYTPSVVEGLSLDASYFDINFKDKIIELSSQGLFNVLIDANQYAGFLNLHPTLAQVNQALSTPNLQVLDFNVPAGFTPNQIKALAYLGFVNAAVVHPKGLDAAIHQLWDTELGKFRAEATATYFLSYDSRFAPSADPKSGMNLVGEPPRLRGKIQLRWESGSWAIYTRMNYTNAYRNQNDVTCDGALGCPVASFTTIDSGIAYGARAARSTVGSGFLVALDVSNIFNRPPPFVGVIDAHYDGANASPLGRTVAFKVVKKW